jgi:hypothetical protein
LTTTSTLVTTTVAPIPKKIDRSTWSLSLASHEDREERADGITRYTITMGTANGEGADTLARKAAYSVPTDLGERIQIGADTRAKATVLVVGETMFGAAGAQIRQGSLFNGSRGGVGFMPTGNRTKGIVLKGAIDLLDSVKPSDVTELARRWYFGTGLPLTAKLTEEALKKATQKHPVAVIWTHPGFGQGGTATPGCVWLIDGVSNGIADGFLWCPPSELESEHGSTYLKDILPTGALSLTDPIISAAECYDLPADRVGAYQAIFGL